jgi:hypothetical protein
MRSIRSLLLPLAVLAAAVAFSPSGAHAAPSTDQMLVAPLLAESPGIPSIELTVPLQEIQMVRAKFRVEAIEITHQSGYPEKTADGKVDYSKPVTREMRTIKASPVFGNGDPSHENTKFWQATPSGRVELGTVNAEAAAIFEVGKEYYVDFTPAG